MYSQDEHTASDVLVPLFIFMPISFILVFKFGWGMGFQWFFALFIVTPIVFMVLIRALLEKGDFSQASFRSVLRKAMAAVSYMAMVGVLAGLMKFY